MPRKQKKFWNSLVRTVFPKYDLANAQNPMHYIGEYVLARKELDQPDEKIKIEHIKGSLKHVKYFEINGSHWVSMYSFFTQMMDGRVPTPEEESEFELSTQITKIKETNGKKEK